MGQVLGSANGTDFGPDLRTRTVHIHSFFASIPVLQVLHLYVSVCICMRARARLHAGARASAQTPGPGRARLRAQLGAHPSRANIRNVSASSFGTAAPRRRAHRPQPKLVRPKFIFGVTEIDFCEKT